MSRIEMPGEKSRQSFFAIFTFSVVMFSCAIFCGCGQQLAPVKPAGNFAQYQSKGLLVSILATKAVYKVGETMPVQISAKNVTDQPIEVIATAGDLAQVKIYRRTTIGWEQALQYPQAAADLITPWKLVPGQKRSWKLDIPVEPTWPSAENLRVAGAINGRPDAVATIIIRVNK